MALSAKMKRRDHLIFIFIQLSLYCTAQTKESLFRRCDEDLFQCGLAISPGEWCISQSWVCDGDQDCPDGIDEKQNCPPPTCPPGKTRCDDGKLCIPKGWQCDGEFDCIDHSDEHPSKCSNTTFSCLPFQHQCDGTNTCISFQQLCDGRDDCPDSSDEGYHCRSSQCQGVGCPSLSHCVPMYAGSHECVCDSKGFYLNSSICVDIDECDSGRFCDQNCSNSPGSFECSCWEGYALDSDNKTCLGKNVPANEPTYIVYSTSGTSDYSEIRQITEKGSNVQVINSSVAKIKAMDFDYSNRSFCYVANDTMRCNKLNTTEKWQVQFSFNLESVTHMAWDWLSFNWYFADESHERILVCSSNGVHCVTLLTTGLKSVKTIAVDPLNGFIFFSTLSEPKIERASLYGEDRISLIHTNQVVRPLALTPDYANKQLYWADSYLEKIERIDYDGTGRVINVVNSLLVEKIAGLDMFQNHIYMSSSQNNSLLKLSKYYGDEPPSTIQQNPMGPYLLKVVHRQRQPLPTSGSTPCQTTKCDHICLTMYLNDSEPYAKCICEAGMKVNPKDATKCISAKSDRFLIYSNAKLGEMKGISLDPVNPIEVMAPITGLERPIAIDYHAKEEFIYYSDTSQMRIGRIKVDGTQRNDDFITTGVSNCEGIAIDWMGYNIFWTDERMKSISVAKISDPQKRKTLIRDNLSHPRAIVVDPRIGKGKMYWTDWVQKPSNVKAKIETAHMDGTNREVLVDSTIRWPNGLSLDYQENVLYWCDAFTDRIEGYDLDGKFRILVATGNKVKHPYGLVHVRFDGDDALYFYWTEFTDGFIKRLKSNPNKDDSNKNNTIDVVTVRNESIPLFEIRLYDNSQTRDQVGNNPCASKSRHNCSHLCLMNNESFTCACPDGQFLEQDGKTCHSDGSHSQPNGCDVGEFHCKNGRCINTRWLCDGDNDCGDSSDEDKSPHVSTNDQAGVCYDRKCPDEENMYMCSNNRCIYKRWMCDGEDDCRNGEDELIQNCQAAECSGGANETRCPNPPRCIPQSWFCDYDVDCVDGFDEQNCTYSSCREDQFTCSNSRCISYEYVCDGDNDCRDNSDELNCGPILGCNMTHELCNGSSQCVDKKFWCDGIQQCHNGADEEYCEDYKQCKRDNMYHCDNGHCIFIRMQCDGQDDCGDNSDEAHCFGNVTCGPKDFKCEVDNHCIPNHWKCDKDNDCSDGSDEVNCNLTTVDCTYPNQLCSDNSTCIKVHQLCDGVQNCPDNSDEETPDNFFCGMDLCQFAPCSHECQKAPFSPGYVCLCPPSKRLGPDKLNCTDVSPCQQWGVCSQRCEEVSSSRFYYHSYLCACNEGYYLDQDQFTCTPINKTKAFIIFSNRHEIRRFELETNFTSYISLVAGLKNTIALDFYYNHSSPYGDSSLVFWTDVVDDKIYRGTLISNSVTSIKAIVNIGLATTEGLAVDWVTQHIYWVESNLDQIEVANFDGDMRATLMTGGMTSPRAIVVDPKSGWLFWTDWDPSYPRIEKATMVGKNRQIIVNVTNIEGGGWPNGLTADFDTQRIYWIDARSDSVHSTKYDGSDHHLILKGHDFLSHPFAITTFGNYIYWTDWRSNALVRADKWTGKNVTMIQRTVTQPFDLHVFHPLRQPIVNNPCARNNGGCGDKAICLLGANAKADCICPHLHVRHDENNVTNCILDIDFLLLSEKKKIRGLKSGTMSNQTYNVMPTLTTPFVFNPLAIDYDYRERKLYWTDDDGLHKPSDIHQHEFRGVIRANLNGTDVQTVIDSSIPNPHGFAIDWISRNIYFSSYAPNTIATISVARLDGVHRSVILEENDEMNPGVVINMTTSLVVEPKEGFMFWSNAAPNNGSIWRANMDGSEAMQIFPNDNRDVEISHPASLVIFDSKLWWVNREGVNALVVNSDLDGKDPTVFLTAGQNDTFRPWTITVRNGFIVAANDTSICSIDRKTLEMKHIGLSKNPVTSLKFFYKSQTEDKNECHKNNGGCDHLCLATPSGRTCKCTDGYELRQSRLCRGMDEFLMYTAKQLILGMSLDLEDETTKALAPISRISQADAIDFYADGDDHTKDWIFWADSHMGQVTNQISRIRRDLSDRDILVSSGVMKIEGIAVDWVAENIYWTDSLRKVIEVAQMNGSNRYVIMSENITDPKAIAVNPNKGMLYWTDLGARESSAKVEQSRMDGSERRVLVSTNISKPFGLTLDYNEKLFWCDQDKKIIEKVDLGTFKRDVVLRNISDCQGLAFYKGYLYWTDGGQGMINRVRPDGTGYEIFRKGLMGSIKDIKIFNRDRRTDDTTNLCARNNGGCDELCFYLGGNKKRCQCAHARVVQGNKCIDYDTFIAFSRVTAIETVHMSEDIASSHNAPYEKIELADHMRNVIGLSFDYKEKRYFFSDIQQGNIQSVLFNGSDVKQVVRDVGSAEGLAFDSVYKDLYWTSYTNSSISRIRVYRETARPEKIVQLATKDHPRAIVLDGCNSKMFWTNWNDHKPSIQSAYMNGWDVKDVITTEIKTPNALTIDHRAAKLYWADARLDKIERCEFDGSNRVKILTHIPQHIFGMALYGDHLYWTDWILRGVMRVSKFGSDELVWLKKGIPRQPMGIIAVANETDNCLANACNFNNGGCRQKCMTNENGEVECGCEENFQLAANGKDCVGNCNVSLEFSCFNGDCISYEFICDGRPQCGDESDERPDICENRVCPDAFFPCWNKQCVPIEKHCNHVNDCGDHSDEKDCSCAPDEFQCGTGSCIQKRYRCDHDKDCPDASDEKGCNITDCSHFNKEGRNDFVRCNSTSACILPAWMCDGNDDCWDGEDEDPATCNDTVKVIKTCAEGWFECKSTKECIPNHWVCDSDSDCLNGEDEANCTYHCDSDKYMCDNNTCIPNSWKCDGHFDCNDHTDEVNCETHKCHKNEFSCNQEGQGQCIPKTWVCDGDKDCQNGEDEQSGTADCDPVPCTPDEVQCLNFQCIPRNFTCDGDDDCGDGSDERNCTYHSCDPQVEFQCDHHKQCIPKSLYCNGHLDCKDGSDEQQCTSPTPCKNSTYFLCNNGDCIPDKKVCDKTYDCSDKSDESLCDIDECALKLDGCGDHECVDKRTSYTCKCHIGYKLANDSKSCVDIDECSSVYPCSHYCANNHGSYRCFCADGYQLLQDKRTCKVLDTSYAPILLVSNRYYIRNVTIDGSQTVLVAMNLTNAVALDYDWKERRIYWSDVTSVSSRVMRMKENGDDVEVLHNTTLRNPDGIAVDWVGRNLYWCDKTTDTIEVSKLNGLYRKILVRDGLQEPRAIAVHPYKGWLFYTDWGDGAHIGRLGMHGSERRSIVTEKLGWPNALTIDYITGHIIWADARLDYIATADLDGKNMRYILKDSQLPHIFAITQFEDYVFWTDWENKSVERARKSDGKDRKVLSQMVHRPMDINLYHPYRQRPLKKNWVNPCADNGGCGNGTMCLIKPGGTDRVCACPEHHYLSADKKHCIANCTTSEFLCESSYKCIPFWWKCDGQVDCPDKSDEPEDCPVYHCRRPGLYQCANATGSYHCISPIQICDGVQQCINGSDEVKCETYTCLESQFKCNDPPRCIPLSNRCNGIVECEDHSDEKECPARTCAPNHFQCNNTRCVPYVWKCDNDNDCGDKSDEPPNCNQTVCKPGYLKCKSGRCIPQSWKCDGDRDCGTNDDSDEPKNECDNVTCDATYFKCANNRCIPGRWRCDYDDDCHDGSDEWNCTARACTESEFRCQDERCILELFRCDGHPQCEDGSDEVGCNRTGCKDTEFTCGNSTHCMPKQWQCDGEVDCIDQSDEQNCKGRCSSDEFMCRHGTACVPRTWRCDGNHDCSDYSDEENCEEHICPGGYFRCKNSRCIPYYDVCNEVNNCGDESDEAHCGAKTCKPDEFQCQDSGQCIKMKLLCDDYRDCADGSDEGNICREIGPCETQDNCTKNQECTKLADSPTSRCFCKQGYMRDPDGCTDIDECHLFGSCQQRCWNLEGKMKCGCELGFKRQNYTAKNIEICVAEGEDPLLFIATRNEIISAQVLKYYVHSSTTHSILPSLQGVKIGGLDVYQGDGEVVVFVTNHEKNGSSIFYFKHKTNKTPSNRVRRQSGGNGDPEVLKLNLTSGEIRQPADIAVDWVSKRLYWTDAGTRMVMSSDFNGSRPLTIAKVNLHKPQGIVVDPESRYVFWTDWGIGAKIERANLDGSDRQTLVSEKIEWPTGLAMDYPNRRLYWADARRRTIESITLDGRNRHVVYQFPSGNGSTDSEAPYKIDVFENFLYVTTYNTHNIIQLEKFSNSSKMTQDKGTVLFSDLIRVSSIVISQQYKQRNLSTDQLLNPCYSSEANKCATYPGSMCVNVPRGQYRCPCPDGFAKNTSDSCTPTVQNPCYTYCEHNHTNCSLTEHGNPKCSCSTGFAGSRCELDLCKGYCNNGGVCKVLESKPTCSCLNMFTGPRCETNNCTGYCYNKGYCQHVSTGVACKCPQGYTGARCDKYSGGNGCQGFNCHNSGKCYLDAQDRPNCQCGQFYSGDHCQICSPRCPQGAHCPRQDCSGHGYCTLTDNGFSKCVCDEGYISKCAHFPDYARHSCFDGCMDVCHEYCLHNNTCRVENGKAACQCQRPWSGDQCEINLCNRRCLHGDCNPQTLNCKCEKGWTGERCNQSISDKCHCHRGNCVEEGSKVVCECPMGYTGPLCSEIVGCGIVRCNHGKCLQLADDYYCRCDPGYMGDTCQEKMPQECLAFCKNGGTCEQCTLMPVHKCESCRCTAEYGGERCANAFEGYTPRKGGSDIVLVAVPLVVCFLIVLLILGVCYFRRRHNGQFKHKRMTEPGNVEINNPIYMRDYEDDEGGDIADGFSFDPDKPTNFTNPMYDTLYNENTLQSPDNEKNPLVNDDTVAANFYGDEERQPLGQSSRA